MLHLRRHADAPPKTWSSNEGCQQATELGPVGAWFIEHWFGSYRFGAGVELGAGSGGGGGVLPLAGQDRCQRHARSV
jgi:hypothetical protein